MQTKVGTNEAGGNSRQQLTQQHTKTCIKLLAYQRHLTTLGYIELHWVVN
eukprot:m.375066 g.375066  ORF g.375066 m.375066 type:complete len:50 (+) comp75677_c0_seq1:217-366(+)